MIGFLLIILGLVPIITPINPQHTMKVDVLPLSYSNGPEKNNISYSKDDGSSVKFVGFDSPLDSPMKRKIPDGPPTDEPPSGRPPPGSALPGPLHDFNPGRPMNVQNNRGNLLLETDPGEENRLGVIRKKREGTLQLNPNNPFLFPSAKGNPFKFPSTKGDSKKYNSPGLLYPGNPFYLSSSWASITVLMTTESTQSNPMLPQGSSETSIPYEDICGRPVSTTALILYGNEVPRGQFPWLVAIFRVNPTGQNYICSGSLISDRHVVTAAHCTNIETQPKDLRIILGKLNITKWEPSHGEKNIQLKSIHVHQDYNRFTSDADIAVLVLEEKVEFTAFIRPLCLWNGNSALENIVGDEGTVVGWGKNEEDNITTEEPKQIQLPIVSQQTCKSSSYDFQYIISNRTFCAGLQNGKGPCNGDSGSGFIVHHQGRWMLRGIVSRSLLKLGPIVCDLRYYIVLTDASKFNDWIFRFLK